MITERMAIHRALAELKIIDDRIESAIDNGEFCAVNKHSNTKINGVPLNEYNGIIVGAYDKAIGLIERRDAMKRAVCLSNAVTKVTVGDVEYTVAEAIEMKNHGITFKEELLVTLKAQYDKARSVLLNKNGDDLEKRAEQYVIGLYGNKEGRVDTEDFEKSKKAFIASNTYDMIDPLDIHKKIEELEEEISSFKAEVDAALSCSNAKTEVEFSY